MSQEDFARLEQQGFAQRGDILGDDWTKQVAFPVVPPRHPDQPAFPTPGIYFGMPEETYHAIHAASTSGLKKLSTSSMDYWANSPLNLDKEERQQRDYFDFGNAIHCLVLEGEEVYAERYVVGLEKPKGALENVDQIKVAIAELGHKPCTTGFDDTTRKAKKEDWIAQLLALDPMAVIWDKMQEDFYAQHRGAEIITHKIDKRVRIAAQMILGHPEIAANFRDGYAEVSIFWYCPVTGCPMKARIDYLKLDRIVDLKSFGNATGQPIDRAIAKAIANYRYNMQDVIYVEAVEAAKRLIRESGKDAVYICAHDDNPIWGTADSIVPWCEQLAKRPEPDFLFVFQQTGIAPVTRGVLMPREGMGVFGITQRRVEELKRVFVANCDVYGTDPWLDIQPISTIEDTDIPLWATEI